MDIPAWLASASIVVLVLISGFLSGAETALTAASRSRMHQWEKEGNKRARLINKLRRDGDGLIGSMLIGSNAFNIFASAIATGVLVLWFGESGVAYATIGMTIIVVIFSEIIPKTYAINYAERMSLTFAPLVYFFVIIFSPFTKSAQFISRGILRLLGIKIADDISPWISDEELRGAIELHAGSDESDPHESLMLRSILDLDKVTVEDIMTHRKDMVMIDAQLPLQKILDEITNTRFTRLPLFKESPDNIVGIIHARTLYNKFHENHDKTDGLEIMDIATDPWFIHETTSLLEQLKAFKERNAHIALVVDEYGSLLGLVTLEDILEEIVGDILDEHDEHVPGVKKQQDGSYIINGTVTIRDLNREFGWNLPDDNASTLAGLVIFESREIPSPGQTFEFYNFRIKILRKQRNQIKLIRLVPPKM